MRQDSISSRHLYEPGSRLTGAFHLAEDQTAMRILAECGLRTDPLETLLHRRRVFRGPIFKRIYAADAEHGRPYVSAKDLVKADIPTTRFLSNAHGALLDELTLREGMILVTCSGMNLGKAIWTRPDMDGLCATHGLLRIEVDPEQCPPGFVFAYLAGRFGNASIRRQIYGGNIKHIEPHHVSGLPVPRVDPSAESHIHELVLAAAEQRAGAIRTFRAVLDDFGRTTGVAGLPSTTPMPYSTDAVPASALEGRLDGFFHSAYHRDAVEAVRESGPTCRVKDLSASVVEPTRFKRTEVDDPAHSVRFFGTAALMRNTPEPSYFIPRSQGGLHQYLVNDKMLLVPRSGQLSGVIGRAILPFGSVVGGAVTEDAIRINCRDEETAGFLFVALSASAGGRQMKARAFGSSIPRLDVHQISAVLLADPGHAKRREIGRQGLRVRAQRNKALELERSAIQLVESAIVEAT